jgi:hypothetical protein
MGWPETGRAARFDSFRWRYEGKGPNQFFILLWKEEKGSNQLGNAK